MTDADIALITGHALDSHAKTLTQNYYHPGQRQPLSSQQRQKRALALYNPEVEVPVYQAGQFDRVLGPGNVFYP